MRVLLAVALVAALTSPVDPVAAEDPIAAELPQLPTEGATPDAGGDAGVGGAGRQPVPDDGRGDDRQPAPASGGAAGTVEAAATRDVQAVGAARFHGDARGLDLSGQVVAIAATPSGAGYWLAATGGAVASFGDARQRGSAAGLRLWEPVVGMAATPSGRGYWLAAADGGVFSYGDATFRGSAGGIDLWSPVVGMAATPSGRGYWLAAADGGVFTYGDARFRGSAGDVALVAPVVGMAATPSGRGYWLVAADGGVFSYGDARFLGSAVGTYGDRRDVIGVARTPDGYVVVAGDGSSVQFSSRAAPVVRPPAQEGFVATATTGHPAAGWWVAGRAVPDTVVVWQPGGLRGDTEAGAKRAAAATGARSSTSHGGAVAVLGVERHGRPVVPLTPGWRLSLSAQGVDPVAMADMLGPTVTSVLRVGEVVVGARTAVRLGVAANDVVRFVGWDGSVQTRRVGAIGAPDAVGDTELTFSVSDAARFGFVRPSAVLIWDFSSRAAIEAATARHVPSGQIGVDVSWRDSGRDEVLSTARLKEELGEFQFRPRSGGSDPDAVDQDPAWAAANIVMADLPILGRLRCHRRIVADLTGALAEVRAAGLGGLVDVADTRTNGGCYYPRLIRSFQGGNSGGALSRHSWGGALDLNPSHSPFGGKPNMDPRMVAIFRRWGFAWGGTWVRPDGHHMEWVGRSP